MKKTNEKINEWKPSFVDAPASPYFKDKAWEFACYLMEFSGYTQTRKLGLDELEGYDDYDQALTWYIEIKKILTSSDLPESFLEACLAKARCLLFEVNGAELKDEDIKREEATEEVTTEEPKTFKVGGKAVDGIGTTETVVKVTKCFVWITFHGNEEILIKRKIRRDSKGNEYIECQKSGYSCKAA